MGGDEVLVAKLSLVAACISFTLAEAAIFRGLRGWVQARSAFFGKLVSCGYCAGFWVSAALVAIVRPRLFYSLPPCMDYLFTGLIMAWLSGMQGMLWCALCSLAGR